MADISTLWNVAAGEGDWGFAGTDLLSGGDLYTAAFISLFSDRVADPDDVIPDGSGDPRGWWGDAGEDRPIGSRLWLLERAKRIDSNLALAKSYAAEALQWMIDDGVVARIDVSDSWISADGLGIVVDLYDQAGRRLASVNQTLWAGVG